MRVLVACEFSGIVRNSFLWRGHDAYSCDFLPTEGGFPERHFQCDVFDVLYEQWDLVIAHPPCTHIANCGNKHYAGTELRKQAAMFILKIWQAPCLKLCIENPVGQINTYLPEMPKPQYIQPYNFGHGETKLTGLWKRNLLDLKATNKVSGREHRIWKMAPSVNRSKERSRFYYGIAEAMADQWGNLNA